MAFVSSLFRVLSGLIPPRMMTRFLLQDTFIFMPINCGVFGHEFLLFLLKKSSSTCELATMHQHSKPSRIGF